MMKIKYLRKSHISLDFRTDRKVPVFVPEGSTTLHKVLGFFTGRRAEFVDPRIVAMAEGREVTRVSTQGVVTVTFNVVLKDLKKFGYDIVPQTLSRASEFSLPVFADEDEKPRKQSKTSVTVEHDEPRAEPSPEPQETQGPEPVPPTNVQDFDEQQVVPYESEIQ